MSDDSDTQVVTESEVEQLLALCRSLPVPWRGDEIAAALTAAGFAYRGEPVTDAYATPWRAVGTYLNFGGDGTGVFSIDGALSTPTTESADVEPLFASATKAVTSALGKPTRRRGGPFKEAVWDLGPGQMYVTVRQSPHFVRISIESPHYADHVTRR